MYLQLHRVERVDQIVKIILRLHILVLLTLRQADGCPDRLPSVGDQFAIALLDGPQDTNRHVSVPFMGSDGAPVPARRSPRPPGAREARPGPTPPPPPPRGGGGGGGGTRVAVAQIQSELHHGRLRLGTICLA